MDELVLHVRCHSLYHLRYRSKYGGGAGDSDHDDQAQVFLHCVYIYGTCICDTSSILKAPSIILWFLCAGLPILHLY